MIDFFFGKPRTGKTYRAVNILYEEYIKDENNSPKFSNILTNIGGFNFKDINQLFNDRGSQSIAYRLVWKKFYEHLSVLHSMALDDKDDAELNRYAYSHKINDCLIIIDEASLYMKKYDDVISWYLAYHGHFKVRIIIIAQSPKQINAEYLVHAEIYYEAQPQSKQLSNGKLRYIHYCDAYFSKDNKFSSDIINTKKEIYDLYKSGEVDKPKKILYKFLFFIVLSIVIMISLYKFLMHRLSPDVPESIYDNNQSSNIEQIQDIQKQSIYKNSDDTLVNVRCNKKYCWNKNPMYKRNQISLTYLKYVLLKNKIELEYFEVLNEVYVLKPLNRGSSKHTLSSLIDYYYFIPKHIQKQYLSSFFIPIQSLQKKYKSASISSFNNNFINQRKADEQQRAP